MKFTSILKNITASILYSSSISLYAVMQFQITLYFHFFSSSILSVCTPKIGIPTKFKRFDLTVVSHTFAKQFIES